MSLPMLPEFMRSIEIGLAPSTLALIYITIVFA
jgi:hypothetical protein